MKAFSELRDRMSPERQARNEAAAREVLATLVADRPIFAAGHVLIAPRRACFLASDVWRANL